MKMIKKEVVFYVLVIAVTTIIKIICAPNIALSGATGILAVALFTGLNKAYNTRNAFLLPLAALLISNTVLQLLHSLNMFPFEGFYKWQLAEYSLVVVLTAVGMLFRKAKTAGVFIAAFAGPTLFYIISNYITWAVSWQAMGYTHDMPGLMNCYVQGLPFYRNSLISTVIMLPAIILAYRWIVMRKAGFALVK
ncbi:MAG TPA: DUF6580 family putative transport protein [Chitinophagaceae bacterium]|nr:DUF6580 family putative transport protein [Chitinophagaceae bacterium]